MRVLIGTSGYNYPEWKGSFYPPEIRPAQMLQYYAERLSTVEVNYTFYRMPTTKVVQGWDAATPPGFTFVLKAPQRITHIARLKDVDDPLRFFLDCARSLGNKLGPILFQLAPTFKKDAGRLGDLLALVPPNFRCAFEFRHDSWFSDDVYDVLGQNGAALCVADTDKGTTPLQATADFGYFRLRDDAGYTKEELARWAETIGGMGRKWKTVFIFFKHEESGIGPRLALELSEILT